MSSCSQPPSFTIAFQHYQNERLLEAEQICQRILQQQPNHVEALQLLGSIADRTGALEASIAYYQQAIALKPDFRSYLDLGSVCQKQGKLDAAIAFYQQAIALKPDSDVYCNLGNALKEQGKFVAAIASYNRALELNSDYQNARFNRAHALLLSGDLMRGFAEYECRWENAQHLQVNPPPPASHPLWDGSALDGRTILIHYEQGFGDVIQFIRYVPLVKQRGGRVLVGCRAPLMRLLSGMAGIERLVVVGGFVPKFDVYVPVLSLPHIFKTTLENIPNQVPYLSVPASNIQIEAPPGSQMKVGIVWAAGELGESKIQSIHRKRSCQLSYFTNLLHLPGVVFYSLQKGARTVDLEQYTCSGLIQDLSHQLRNFADTAAILSQLDLVITVDTAVAHLAGALGKPVWVLLPFAPNWRWLLGRDDSPWYPSMRLFRQDKPGDWAGVFAQVGEALSEKV